jgi:P27 family predicted phage terminase small subunit
MTEELPAAPSHLSKRAKGLWESITDEFLLAAHQFELLRRACEASDRADAALALLKKDGLTEMDRFGQRRPHPAVAVERDSRIGEARLLRELALSPEEPGEPRPPRTGAAGTERGRR